MGTPEDDIDDWIDSLAGKASKHKKQDPEANAIRESIVRRLSSEGPTTEDSAAKEGEEHAWQKLAFRMRREGLTGRSGWSSARLIPAAAAAALLATIGTTLLWGPSEYENFPITETDAPRYRSAIVVIETSVTDPTRVARKLAHALEPFAAEPRIYVFGGRAVLDLNVNVSHISAVKNEFEKSGVRTDALLPGLVRVVFNAKT